MKWYLGGWDTLSVLKVDHQLGRTTKVLNFLNKIASRTASRARDNSQNTEVLLHTSKYKSKSKYSRNIVRTKYYGTDYTMYKYLYLRMKCIDVPYVYIYS